MKQNIPTGAYALINASYVPLIDSVGTCCENCGRLISNIVTVEHESGKKFTIGQDCAKTIMSKQQNAEISTTINHETRVAKKISELKKAGKSFVLNGKGWPCYPPETRHGYFIPY